MLDVTPPTLSQYPINTGCKYRITYSLSLSLYLLSLSLLSLCLSRYISVSVSIALCLYLAHSVLPARPLRPAPLVHRAHLGRKTRVCMWLKVGVWNVGVCTWMYFEGAFGEWD